jgi:hypothetical protein
MPRSRIVRGSTNDKVLAERVTMLEARVAALEGGGAAPPAAAAGVVCFEVEGAAERLRAAAERERGVHMPSHIATALALGEATRIDLYGDAPPVDPGPMDDVSPDDDFEAAEFIPGSNTPTPPPAIPADAMDAIASFAAAVDDASFAASVDDGDSDGTIVEEAEPAAEGETINIPLQDGGSIVLRTDGDFTVQLRNLRNSELRQLARALEVSVDRSANKTAMVETIANFLMS